FHCCVEVGVLVPVKRDKIDWPSLIILIFLSCLPVALWRPPQGEYRITPQHHKKNFSFSEEMFKKGYLIE
ncbi:MAG: hypothetical protein ACI35R_16420, partial [Bacillus sp. (in: firmicutes)]